MATGGAYKVTYPSCTGSMQLLLMHTVRVLLLCDRKIVMLGEELWAVGKQELMVTEVVTLRWTDAADRAFRFAVDYCCRL